MGDARLEADDVCLVQSRIGWRIDRFVVDGVLFVGATSAIHTAVDTAGDGDGGRVVLEYLHPRLRDDEGVRGDLLRKALVGSRIAHPAYVSAHGLGHGPDGAPYVVLDHVDGDPVDEIVRRDGPLAIDAALAVAEEALGVVSAAHLAGLVHGPLRATKLLVHDQGPRDGALRVLDCGARPRRASVAARQAPELLDDETAPDVAAVGVVLFGLLAGVRVLHLAPPPEAVRRIAREAIADTPAAHGLDAAIADVILRAIGHGRPFRTAREMRAAITGVRDALVWQTAFGETRGHDSYASPPSGVRAGGRRYLLLVEEDEEDASEAI